ncbi:mevalonate kinase [Methanobrevibacter olleyae]|uniref:Mevalonate kinase n=1 Tax=Methanobrevibacter olleyae TaxID=294671 RepID=A0A126QZ47_METOL|nr:mevalonate kinase [Methanobrevibacter olleyae]AMK15042.1 mevalonate kinase Mvk [Methanobrevibacter olleyae]
MKKISVASAPGKTILFGEHSVVYDEPAIAGAVNKRATVSLCKSHNNYSTLKSNDLGFEVIMDTRRGTYTLKRGKPGIIRYILNAMGKFHDHTSIDMDLSLNLPIGSGLGSSAAVTVATIAALHHYHGVDFNKETLAKEAHAVEEEVQGIASPLDTLVSTYGGLVYLSREKRIVPFDNNLDAPFVIGYTSKYGNTGKVVKKVKTLKNNYPELVNPIIDTMGKIANEARVAILKNDIDKIADLMNLNQGLLDSLGVNTYELSRMIYTARDNGAVASKITGSGGGGSIISLCREDNVDEVAEAINVEDRTIKVKFSKDGVLVNRKSPPLS